MPHHKRLLPALAMAGLALACGSGTPTESTTGAIPTLEDAIPYDALGGGRIAFSRVGPPPGDYEAIYVVDLDERRAWGFDPHDPAVGLDHQNFFIAWRGPSLSPDGVQIAFTGGIWPFVVEATGRDLVRLARGREDGTTVPTWKTTGNEIYFWDAPTLVCGQDNTLRAQVPTATGVDQVVATVSILVSPDALSVSGAGAVLFNGGGCAPDTGVSSDTSGIYVLDLGTGERHLVIPDVTDEPPGLNAFAGSLAWAPDGTRFAFFQRRTWFGSDLSVVGDTVALVVASADGTGRTEIFRRPASAWQFWCCELNRSVAWSPDGNRLLFDLPEADFESHLFVIGADGSNLQRVTSTPGVSDRSPSWSR